MDIFRIILLFVFTVFMPAVAYAQACASHPVLESYEVARDNDLDRWESLSDSDKEALKAIYSTMEGAATDYASTKLNNPVPIELITNFSNFKKIAQGNLLDGGLGIYSNVVGKLSPTLGDSLANMWKGTIDGLSGTGENFPKREDNKNRAQANIALSAANCGPMTLPAYAPPNPFHLVRGGLCGVLNLSSFKGVANLVLRDGPDGQSKCNYDAVLTDPDSNFQVGIEVEAVVETRDLYAQNYFSSEKPDSTVTVTSGIQRSELSLSTYSTGLYLHRNMIVRVISTRTSGALLPDEMFELARMSFAHFSEPE